MSVLTRMSAYFADGKALLTKYLDQKKGNPVKAGFCCLSISPQELNFAYAREIEEKITIEICHAYPYKNDTDLQFILTELVKQHHLKDMPCSLMLQPDDYQLLITDGLPVAKTEFQEAIRWKVKDLIRFPTTDVLIDSFDMPQMKNSVNKIMIVAAQASKLKKWADQIEASGFHLNFIDISELALRNIAVMYEKGEDTIALVYIKENFIQLLFIVKQQIYISRILKIILDTSDQDNLNQGMERLATEIQRSYDYFQSLWNKPIPTQFLFAATKPINKEALDILAERIRSQIKMINLEDLINIKPKMSVEEQGQYLTIMGGILRESAHATAN